MSRCAGTRASKAGADHLSITLILVDPLCEGVPVDAKLVGGL
jgi:hypothetical protein